MHIKKILNNLTKKILNALKFKIYIFTLFLICGCQALKIEPSREIVKAGNSKQKFITGLTISLPFLKNQKILLKGVPHKDPNHNEIIRQEYLTSIRF
jgi:hypothetical protein